jgi:catalase-peroxidase
VHHVGLGWKNEHGTGKGGDTITSGLEGAWTPTPTQWDNSYWDTLFGWEWELTESPAGAKQWKPKNPEAQELVPDAHVPGKKNPPMMATTDLALITDPEYRKISERFRDDPAAFADAYARAWYKLLHRDMGPVTRLLGPWVPEAQIWQDPVPAGTPVSDVAAVKKAILDSGLSVSDLVQTAWASAATFRSTDLRGGANGARIALAPQKDWDVNKGVAGTVAKLQEIAKAQGISLADAIVLGGTAAVEKAAADAGVSITVDVKTGRGDATQEQTDVESFDVLEPRFDGFRNYLQQGTKLAPETLLVERAYLLGLTPKKMTVLVGGLRVLGAGVNDHGVLTDRVGALTTDFFVNLLESIPAGWQTSSSDPNVFEADGKTATAVDLVFASNSILRGIAEVYAASDARERFVKDFADAWVKVMENDLF